jgi:hypothetical protein
MGNIKTPAANRSPATSATTTRADRRHRGPLDSNHPCGSMRRCAGLLALWHEAVRTRHACYRAMRLVHEHFGQDPATLRKDQFQDCILDAKAPMADAASWCPGPHDR